MTRTTVIIFDEMMMSTLY